MSRSLLASSGASLASLPAPLPSTPDRPRRLGIAVLLLVWLVLTIRLVSHLPLQPQMMGDSQDYLALASHRPPVYGWFLSAYRLLNGSVRFLPALQFLLMQAGLLVFAIELGLLLDSSVLAAIGLVVILQHPAIHDAARLIMTESLFLALTLGGMGMLFRTVRRPSLASLLGASALFALAAATRTTGTAFLPLVPLVLAFDRRLSGRAALRRSAQSIAGIALVLLLAMTGNWLRNDRFEIGSFAGVAFLGKALLLLQPSDLPLLPPAARPAAAATVHDAAEARALVAHAPDAAAAMRAQMQVSEDLRFAAFFPAALRSWPAFAAADWRQRSVLGMGVAKPLILAHPLAYARLWFRDWQELVLYPNFWPAWATAEPAPHEAFSACRLQSNCYSLGRYTLGGMSFATLTLASLGGLAVALLIVLTGAGSVLRRRADPRTALFFWLAVILHASLLLSAAAEAGFARYTVAIHVTEVAVLLWFVAGVIRRPWREHPAAAGRPA